MNAREKKAVREALAWRTIIEDADATEADRTRFERWLNADDQHRQAYDYAEHFWQTLGTLPEQRPDALTAKRLRSTGSMGGSPFSSLVSDLLQRPRTLAIGGLAAVSLFAVMLVVHFDVDVPSDIAESTSLVSTTTLSTDFGEVRTFTLDDGSVVTLGARSRLTVDIGDSARRAELQAGDAFFAVHPDRTRPFTVHAGKLQVQVTGTQFDVQLNSTSTQVAVREGTVELTMESSQPTNGVSLQQRRPLRAGQSAIARQNGIRELPPMPDVAVGAWRLHRLVYLDTPLHEVTADLGRYHSAGIEIADASIASIEVSGTFDVSNVDRMLLTLSELLELDLTTDDEGVIRLWSRR